MLSTCRADGSLEPVEAAKTYPGGRLRVRILSPGKEKRGITEACLVRCEVRGGGAAAASASSGRPVAPQGDGANARSVSAASPTRTSSSVEGDFPSLYSQFAGDEVSVVSSLSQPGRWRSEVAKSYASEHSSVEPDDFFTLGRSVGGIG